MRRILGVAVILILCLSGKSKELSTKETFKKSSHMKIQITIGDQIIKGELYDNSTAKDLVSQLPAEIVLEDYARTEKIYYPEKKLSTSDAPAGYQPSTGDITYYAPWGDIAIFYKSFGYASGLVSVGKINEGDIEKLKFPGDKKATIELLED